MNSCILIGRTTKDAELTVLNNANKTNVIKFTLAVERDYVNKSGVKDVDFINVELMGKDLSKLASYVKKGKQLSVQGSIQIDKYDEKYYTKIKAHKIELLGGAGAPAGNTEAPKEPEFESVEDDDVPF